MGVPNAIFELAGTSFVVKSLARNWRYEHLKLNESQYTALFVVSESIESFSQLIVSIFTFLNQ